MPAGVVKGSATSQADTAAAEDAAAASAEVGPAVSEALAAANEAASLGDQALQHSTAASSGHAMTDGSHIADWLHVAHPQQSAAAVQQLTAEQMSQAEGFGYLLTTPNLPAGLTYQQVRICMCSHTSCFIIWTGTVLHLNEQKRLRLIVGKPMWAHLLHWKADVGRPVAWANRMHSQELLVTS